MSADRMVGGASAQKNNAVPLRKNQRKSLENSCRNTKNRLANPGSGALPNHNRQESCASMGTTLVFNICQAQIHHTQKAKRRASIGASDIYEIYRRISHKCQ